MKLVKDIDLSAFMEDDAHQKIRPASEYRDALLDDLYGEKTTRAARLPWSPLHGLCDLRPGELVAWAGSNGTGKTYQQKQIASALNRQGFGVLVVDLELHVARSLRRFVRQATRSAEPSTEYIDAWMRWTDRRLWMFDHQGSFSAEKLLAVLRWTAANLPVQFVLIDSFMKLEIATDDYNLQKSTLNRMQSLALETGLGIIVVMHTRKGLNEGERVDKYSVKGTGDIVDQVDTLILISRNVSKERQVEEWQQQRRDFANPSDDMLDVLSAWDAGLRVAKQRHGTWEGAVPLWLDRRAMAFSDRSDAIVPAIPIHELVPRDLEQDAERAAIQTEGAAA